MKKKILPIVILFLVFVSLTSCTPSENIEQGDMQYKAKIVSIREETSFLQDGEDGYTKQHIEIEILDGEYKGQRLYTESFLDVKNYKNFDIYKVGDRISVEITTDLKTNENYVSINTHIRVPTISIISLLFLATIVIIAGIKGLKTILALILTVSCVVFILVPMISKGYNPVISALLSGIIVTGITLTLVGGLNRKTFSAIIGTFLGLACATVFSLVASKLMRVTGISTEAVGMIMITDLGYELDIRGIFTAGIIIGCLGAVMDVGMSIASSVAEIKKASIKISKKELFYSGMRVGRDIMGTMANTLILAYTGSAIMQMVVWKIYGISFLDMLNREYIATEVVRALCGSFGMLLTIPITCVISSRIISIDIRKLEDETSG